MYWYTFCLVSSRAVSTSDGFILQTPYLPHPPVRRSTVALCARLAWFVRDEPALDACYMIRRIGAFVQLRPRVGSNFIFGEGIAPSPNDDTLTRSAISSSCSDATDFRGEGRSLKNISTASRRGRLEATEENLPGNFRRCTHKGAEPSRAALACASGLSQAGL